MWERCAALDHSPVPRIRAGIPLALRRIDPSGIDVCGGVIAVLTTLAMGQFSKYIDRSKSEAAKAEIAIMSVEMERYRNRNDNALPDSLADIGRGAFLDPWQRPYHYTKLQGVKGKGSARKDHKLNPINSDFDLFSAGKNGVYKPQISQKDSLDDIIRARDGSFIGLASEM